MCRIYLSEKHEKIKFAAGFTLIELLVAVSIFATLALVLFSSFRAGAISWRRVASEQAFQQSLRGAFGAITRDFKNMLYLSSINFEGTADKVSFVGYLNQQGDSNRTIGRISYYIKTDENTSEKILVRSEELLADALRIESLAKDIDDSKPVVNEFVVLDNVEGIKFSYLALQKEEQEGSESRQAEYDWQSPWEPKDVLPAGIKVELTLNAAETKREVKITKRIWIPMGRLSNEAFNPEAVI